MTYMRPRIDWTLIIAFVTNRSVLARWRDELPQIAGRTAICPKAVVALR